MGEKTSRLSGFYARSLEERLNLVSKQTNLTEAEKQALVGDAEQDMHRADNMIENVVGQYALPMGIATNFLINGHDVLVPMVIEEPSVVAGASYAAKLAREGGGFRADCDDPIMIGQIQLIEVPDPLTAKADILTHKDTLLSTAHAVDPVLVRLGGGARDIQVRLLDVHPPMLIVHLLYDVRDAMGANVINTACERLAPLLENISGGRAVLRILSNLADQRLARARVSVPESALAFDTFSGAEVAQGIEWAWRFAAADPYRAATHNKGIMNGVDAVVLATGNDWRAVEAGAHAYAARDGHYTSLSTWQRDGQGNLTGTLEMPMALGIVGGATRVHPAAQIALKILEVKTSSELAAVVVSVGLAQNLAALRALATEGIQRGHMSLHARQVAIASGAHGEEIMIVAEAMIRQGVIRADTAEMKLAELRTGRVPFPD
ncbi:MAG: hydroxymethylglutaryl-CoA reductase, degradative [Anaerolineae bacterium]|nr:hydroxymethylglutaryl-CoA reductase, degradative [Anaerolineae bacterium]